MEHHAVAEPLHGTSPEPARLSLDQPGQARRELGGRVVAALFGQSRVAGQVEEHHGGRSRRPLAHEASVFERRLHVLDDVFQDVVLLVAPVQPPDDVLHDRLKLGAHLGSERQHVQLTHS